MQQREVPTYTATEFQPKKAKYALIIPVINEGERIKNQLLRSRPWFSAVDAILVDGGSTDGSMEQRYLAGTGIRTLLLKTGPGKLSAQIRVGLAYALDQGYEGTILIDGNNKDNPEAIPLFIGALDDGYDHVQGSRFIEGGKMINNPPLRILGLKVLHAPLISIAAGYRYTDTTNGYRAYSKKLLDHPEILPFRELFSKYELHYYLAIQAGRQKLRIKEVPVERVYPPGKVPTKISGFRGNLLILQTLWRAATGFYNPSSTSLTGDHPRKTTSKN